jgi:pentalenolactone synthase
VVAIDMGVLCLLANPAQRQALAEDPDQVLTAVEEMLRVPGRSGGGIPRYARASLRIGEVTVRAGELVLLDNRAANHDPAVFPSPGRLDITATGRATSPSGTARTTASAPRSPASNCRLSSPSCRPASPRCGSRSRPSSCPGAQAR